MGCGGLGGCGGSSSASHKTSNHSPKKMPNWGMKSSGAKKSNNNYSGSSNFGTPRVKMSFSGKSRGGY